MVQDGRFMLVQTLLDGERLSLAEKELQSLIREFPDSTETLHLLAQLQALKGKAADALECIRRAMGAGTKRFDLRATELWILALSKKTEDVISCAREMQKDFPSEPYPFVIEAETLYFRLKAPEAKVQELLNHALQLSPQNTNARKIKFWIAYSRRDESTAASFLQTYFGLDFGSEGCSAMISSYVRRFNVLAADSIREFILKFPQNESFVANYEFAAKRATDILNAVEIMQKQEVTSSFTEQPLPEAFDELGIADLTQLEKMACQGQILRLAKFLLRNEGFQPSRDFWNYFWPRLKQDELFYDQRILQRIKSFECGPPLGRDDLPSLLSRVRRLEGAIQLAVTNDPVQSFDFLMERAATEAGCREEKGMGFYDLAHFSPSPLPWTTKSLEQFLAFLVPTPLNPKMLMWLDAVPAEDFLRSADWPASRVRVLDRLLERGLTPASLNYLPIPYPICLKLYLKLHPEDHAERHQSEVREFCQREPQGDPQIFKRLKELARLTDATQPSAASLVHAVVSETVPSPGRFESFVATRPPRNDPRAQIEDLTKAFQAKVLEINNAKNLSPIEKATRLQEEAAILKAKMDTLMKDPI